MNPFFFQSARHISRTLPLYTFANVEYSGNRLFVEINPIDGQTDYLLEISETSDFDGATQVELNGATTYEEFAQGSAFTSELYIRFRGNTTITDWSEIWNEFPQARTQLEIPTIQSVTANEGSVTLTTTTPTANIEHYVWQYKLSSSGTWITHATVLAAAQDGNPHTYNGLTSESEYDFRVQVTAENYDYIGGFSSIASATPTAGVSQLSAPNGLAVDWDDVTEGSGNLSWNSVNAGGATVNYSIYIDQVFIMTITALNYDFLGLTVGDSYDFEVVASAAGYDDSNPSSITRTAPDLDADYIDIDNDFNANPYYKPLDGRTAFAVDFPLIDYTVLDETAFDALSTGLTYSNYSKGVCKITAKSNDGLGTTLSNVFAASDVGKEFCGLKAHRDAPSGVYVDEFEPYVTTSRLANVIAVDDTDGEWALVDLAFNGGDMNSPDDITNGRGYIFEDNSDAYNSAIAATQNPAYANELRLSPLEVNDYVLPTYVVKNIEQATIATPAKIWTGTTSRARIKFGVEDHYMLERENGTNLYTHPKNLFNFNNLVGNFISHNIQWIPPHYSFLYVDTFDQFMFGGNVDDGVAIVINGENDAEKEELEAGGNLIGDETFLIASSNMSDNGTYTGSGELRDVATFGYDAHINISYNGVNALGAGAGGSTAGAHFLVFDDFSVDYNPQTKWRPVSQTFKAEFTTDFSGINDTGGGDDPSTKSYWPDHCLECTDNSNILKTAIVGGNRLMMMHWEKFTATIDGYSANEVSSILLGYYNLTFNGNETPLEAGANTATSSVSNGSKMILPFNIPVSGNTYTISRNYMTENIGGNNTLIANPNVVPKVGMPFKNCIRTAISFPTVLGKTMIDFTASDREWIAEANRKPLELQIDDTFKLMAWCEVDDDTGFSAGQSVTINDGSSDIATATIERIDNYKYDKRIILKGCTANIATGANITNGSETAAIQDNSGFGAASDFDPEEIYRAGRKQRGRYPGGSLRTSMKFTTPSEQSNFAKDDTITGQTSGAEGTVKSVSDEIEINVTSGKFQAGEQISNGSFTADTDATYNAKPDGQAMHILGEGYTLESVYSTDRSNSYGFSNLQGYYYSNIILDKDLPDLINGNDYNDPIFDIEVVNSESEYTLSESNMDVAFTYRGNTGYANNYWYFVNDDIWSRKIRYTRGGIDIGYGNLGRDNNLSSFGSSSWVFDGDALGHLSYQVAEVTRYLRGHRGAGGNMRPGNRSNADNTTLGGRSKGYWLIDCENINRFGETDKNSSAGQFDDQWLIYANNPSYTPPYDGEISWPPKFHVYGANALTYPTEYEDPTGSVIVRDENLANAPDLPQPILDILATLPS